MNKPDRATVDVGTIRDKCANIMNIESGAIAFIDGTPADDDAEFGPGQVLEFFSLAPTSPPS